MPRWLWVALAVAGSVFWWTRQHAYRPLAPAAMATGGSIGCAPPPPFSDPDTPHQTDNDGRMPQFRLGTATVTPLAGFSLQARVLSRENYSFGREADYSPTDLALGWRRMADPGVSDRLAIGQSNRWYNYRWGPEGPPIPPDEIVASSANMHMIPANAEVARNLARIRRGDTVRLDGWLVQIEADDGWRWRSSTSREDSGGGACEVVYVCSISAR